MDPTDVTKRKPRRTFGTPSSQHRNRFSALAILSGVAVFYLWTETLQIASTAENSSISKYFLSPEKRLNGKETKQVTLNSPTNRLTIDDNKVAKPEPKTSSSKPKTTRAKRTKLDAFVYKTAQTVPTETQTAPKLTNDDDFAIPEKKVKKAPPRSSTDNAQAKGKKPPRRKKQTTIKSAFLRNEQLFAEIAAQHCAADNFNGDDIQLAIAISKSEAESNGIDVIGDNNLTDDIVNGVNDDQKAEKIRQTLEKYGFRTADTKDYNAFAAAFMPLAKVRRPKSKWANKFTALTLRDDQLQNQKLQQKIETLLSQHSRTKSLTAAEQHFSDFVLQSAQLRKCDKERKRNIVSLSENPQMPNEMYFVAELFEISKLPPGHLLKDWNAIQGRDLTPKKYSHNYGMESKLQGIYVELEKYFKSLKTPSVINDSVKVVVKREENDYKIVGNVNNNDVEIVTGNLNEDTKSIPDSSLTEFISNTIRKVIPHTKDLGLMQVSNSTFNVEHNIELPPKGSQANDLDDMNISCRSIKVDAVDKSAHISYVKTASNNLDPNLVVSSSVIAKVTQSSKPLEDLMKISNSSLGVTTFINVAASNNVDPLKKSHISEITETAFNFTQKDNSNDLNLMQVSSNSVIAQTIGNTTQNNRSNSPDLFADSDVEMQDNDNASENTTKKYNCSLNSFEGLTTYEIYSSDEVKNTSSLVRPNLLPECDQKDISLIDLTQDDDSENIQIGLNQSKTIEEIDLFADSPRQDEDDKVIDINSNTQQSKYLKSDHHEASKFSLSPCETNVESPTKNMDKKSFKFTLNTEDKDINAFIDEVDDALLREIETNQTNTSFSNLQDSKQFERCFHRETPIEHQTAHKETKLSEIAYKKSPRCNEKIFRELYSKYLGSSPAQNGTNHKAIEPVLGNSFTQVFPRVITPVRGENGTQFTTDLNTTFEYYMNNRKSLSFVSKTPEKSRVVSNCKRSKSQSFNEKNICIDLTQNEDATVEEEDDEYLVLSDDEINYSIWTANKISRLDETDADFGKERGKERKESKNNVLPSNSSLFDILSKETSPPTKSLLSQQSYSDLDANRSKPKELHLCSHLANKVLSPSHQTYSEFKSLQPEEQNMQLERSNFGILEEFSQPIDFTPNICTPTKAMENVSFLESPAENTAPMKRFSRCRKSVHELNELVNHLDVEYTMDEYDEFDFQIGHNRSNKSTTTTLPRDLDQLLTADISFENPDDKSPNKKNSSIDFENIDDGFKPSVQTSSLKQMPKVTSHSVSEKQELTINNKTYTIRYAGTTKPDYTLYSEAELLKKLYNFGIKPLKRKQAVKMLEYIYIQTHPIIAYDLITANPTHDCDISDDSDIASLSKSKEKFSLPHKDSILLSSQKYLDTQSSIIPSFTQKIQQGHSNNYNLVKKLNLHDASGMEMLRYSLDLKNELVDEQYVLQTNVSKKTPQPLMPFHIAWFNLVCSNRNLHENILMYEPIDLQEIYIFLKGLGYRYDPKELKQFFDRRCIIFRYDLAAAGGNNRHVRKKKSDKRNLAGP